MKIYVTAKPRAKKEEVKKIDECHFVVSVKEPPVQGRANTAIIEALAKYFAKPKNKIIMVSGYTSREKIFEVLG